MKETIHIRKETEADYETVETIIRKSFYNLYIPGCFEHYLAHVIRPHKDFIPELDLVIEYDGKIIGNIMYTKAKLVDASGTEKDILTFGPVCIFPEYQRKGYGRQLLEYSFEQAASLGYDTIVIFGSPANYVGRGFKSCKKYNVCLEDGSFPAAMMVKELRPGVLDGRTWMYYQSQAFNIDEQAAQEFDDALEKMEKKELPCQEEFFILSHSTLQ